MWWFAKVVEFLWVGIILNGIEGFSQRDPFGMELRQALAISLAGSA